VLYALHFSPDGKYIVHASTQSIRVWCERRYVGECPGSLVGMARDGQTLITRHLKAKTFHAWHVGTLTEVDISTLDPTQYSPNQRYYIEGNRLVLTFYDALGIEAPRTLDLGPGENSACDRWALSPDGTLLAVAFTFDAGGHDAAWGTCFDAQGNKRFSFDISRFVFIPVVYFAEQFPLLAVSSDVYTISLLLTSGKPVRRFKYQPQGGTFIAVSPYNQNLIALHVDKTVWRLYQGDRQREVTEQQAVLAVAFHPNGEHIASLTVDGAIHMYALETLQMLFELQQT